MIFRKMCKIYLCVFLFEYSPRRKLLFQTMFPGILLPPRPLVTRWGTWLNAAIYLADNFDRIQAFLNEVDSDDAKCIAKAKEAIAYANIKSELAFGIH